MDIKINLVENDDDFLWDSFVNDKPQGNLYQLFGWKKVIEQTYGHKAYYLIAANEKKISSQLIAHSSQPSRTSDELSTMSQELNGSSSSDEILANTYEFNSSQVVGILPLVHLKHFIFDNSLISIPFFDLCGYLADSTEVEKLLLAEAINLGKKLGVQSIEIRNGQSSSWPDTRLKFQPQSLKKKDLSTLNTVPETKPHKVRMLLELPDSPDTLMKSFKSKLRSQIRRPLKEGLASKIGGLEMLDDFYAVFSKNMRDLGSPVHSKKLIQNVIKEFLDRANIVTVYKGKQPIAASLIIGFKDTLENPWASALREFSWISPNMLLYWAVLEYGCENGYKYFDFGRCTPDGGTYNFKKQWGAKPVELHWQYISLKGKKAEVPISENSKYQIASQIWSRLPVPLTRLLGPMIRKHIGL